MMGCCVKSWAVALLCCCWIFISVLKEIEVLGRERKRERETCGATKLCIKLIQLGEIDGEIMKKAMSHSCISQVSPINDL